MFFRLIDDLKQYQSLCAFFHVRVFLMNSFACHVDVKIFAIHYVTTRIRLRKPCRGLRSFSVNTL